MIKRKNIVVGVTTLAIVLSSGAIAFAATGTTDSQVEKSRPAIMSNLTEAQRDALQQAQTESLTEALATLVDSGTISQEEADKLTEIRVEKKAEFERHKMAGNGPASILTVDQRTALKETVKANLESKLADLVDDGTLTQELVDQLLINRGDLHFGPGGKHGHGFGGPPNTAVPQADTEDTSL